MTGEGDLAATMMGLSPFWFLVGEVPPVGFVVRPLVVVSGQQRFRMVRCQLAQFGLAARGGRQRESGHRYCAPGVVLVGRCLQRRCGRMRSFQPFLSQALLTVGDSESDQNVKGKGQGRLSEREV